MTDCRLGRSNKSMQTARMGEITWTCEEGRLHLLDNGEVIRRLSAVNTLALTNMLYGNYKEIVEEARAEQRKREVEKERQTRANLEAKKQLKRVAELAPQDGV